MSEAEAPPEIAPWKLILAAMLPLMVALPIGFATSAVLVHVAFLIQGLEPWRMSADELIAAFGPLELSLGGAGNQLAFLALLTPSLAHPERRRFLFGTVHPSARGPGFFILAGVGMYALSSALSVLVSLLGLQHEGTLGQLNDVMARLSLVERLSLLPVLSLSAGVLEELFFRGLLFRRLPSSLSSVGVVALTAAAFGIAHLDPVHSSAAFIMGLYLGWLRLRSGSVWPGLFAHAFSNGAVVLSHGWLDDLSDIPLFGLTAGAVVSLLAIFAISRRLKPQSA